MTVTFVLGTLTQISANFINPYTGELLAINGDYYINDQYVNGGAGSDDALLGSTHDQFFSLEDSIGDLLLEGFEQFYMAPGNDILLLASSTHILGDLIIQVSDGDDIVWSNAGNDVIGGGLGNDILHGGPGNDDIDGGDDNDRLTGGQGNDTINGGDGIDVAVYAGAFSNYVITDNSGVLTIEDTFGTDGTDTVENVESIEFVDGVLEAGIFTPYGTDDVFIGTGAVQVFDGGGGTDTVDYSGSTARVIVTLSTGGTDGDANGDTYISIENLIGTNLSARDYLYGDAGDNYIQGLGGNDFLHGGAGADILDGGVGWGDYARYERSSSGVDVDLTRAVQIGGDAQGDVLLNIEFLYGSYYDDILTGDAGGNYLEGFYGNDIMEGGLGNDRLIGGHDDDTYIYSVGHDRFDEKGSGYDTVVFDSVYAPSDVVISGNILSFVGNTSDEITFNDITLFEEFQFDGFAAMDLATLQSYNSPIPHTGTSGDDVFIGTGAVQVFDGGGGTDTVDYSGSTARVIVTLSTGGTDGDANGDTYISIENLIGTNLSARDYLYGDAGDNYIQGLGGNDFLHGGAGADILDGGVGWGDYARYERSSSGVDVDLTRAVQIGGDAQGDVLLNIEFLYGSYYDDILTGDAGGNYLEGFYGNDIMEGGLGNDRLIGGHDDDTYIYSVGHDRFDEKGSGYDTVVFDSVYAPSDVVISGNILSFVGNTSDEITFNDITLFEEFQFDGFAAMDLATLQSFETPLSYTGTNGNDTFIGTSAVEIFDGGFGTDTVDYSASVSSIQADLQANLGTAGDAIGDSYISIENLTGTGFSDYLYGDAGVNYLQGLAGDDYLEGGAGADTLDGGADGDYAMYTRSGSAVRVDLNSATQIGGDAEGDVLLNIEHIQGSDYSDTLSGNSGENYLRGGEGHDFLSARGGDDWLYGDAGADTLLGGDDDDHLYGGSGSDALYAGAGNDMLYGGSGNDVLDGGTGADTYVFEGPTAFDGSDKVYSFSIADGDVLDISDVLSGYDPLTDAISDFVQITNSGSDSIFSIDYDGGADNFVQIAKIIGVTGLTDEAALEVSGNLITV